MSTQTAPIGRRAAALAAATVASVAFAPGLPLGSTAAARSRAAAAGTIVPVAGAAARRPSRAEAAAIRKGALRALTGAGWRVSNIHVSTVRAAHRYASASVKEGNTGVGGEMILRRDGARWKSIFLGSDGFCGAHAPKRVLNDLGFRC
jgi:hypothetical protein